MTRTPDAATEAPPGDRGRTSSGRMRMPTTRRLREIVAAMTAVAGLAVAGVALTPTGQGTASAAPSNSRPNVVLINADDLTEDLLPAMPNVRAMVNEGWSADNFIISNSLCCPSRVSLFSGRYSHNSDVWTNSAPNGGFVKWDRSGGNRSTLATDLQSGGYQTALIGKYLNGYKFSDGSKEPGWDYWKPAYSGSGGDTGWSDTIADLGSTFVAKQKDTTKPFFLYLAPTQPHSPWRSSAEDQRWVARNLPGAKISTDPRFNKLMKSPVSWLKLQEKQSASAMDTIYRKRLASAHAVDRLVGSINDALSKYKLDDNTYVMFTSDNGFHLGHYALSGGKMTPYEMDVNLPLVVTGPGVRAGSSSSGLVQNVDFRETVTQLAGVASGRNDGVSFAGMLSGSASKRSVAIIEHGGSVGAGPDAQASSAGNPPKYVALRTAEYLYVVYSTGEREYHDLRTDPNQLSNTFASLNSTMKKQLAERTTRLAVCSGAGCRQ